MILLCVSGIPGSGKTTLANEIVRADPSWVRVNKDDIRAELEATGWRWSPENESRVKAIRDERIGAALAAGLNVVSDDTNFGKHRGHLRDLALKHGAEYKLKVIDTPVEECVRRDALRLGRAQVGERVIRRMWCANMAPPVGSYTFAPYRLDEPWRYPSVVLCDLDGTLALKHDGRDYYDASTCDQDAINTPVQETLEALENHDIMPIFLSGREDAYRVPTEAFLRKAGFAVNEGRRLFMRPSGDNRADWVIKGELFDRHIRGRYNVRLVLDDRQQVVDFWRSIGLTCFQVAKGDF